MDSSRFGSPELVRYPSGGAPNPGVRATGRAGSVRGRALRWWSTGTVGPQVQEPAEVHRAVPGELLDLGLAVVVPNVRGSDGYGKAYLAADDGVKQEGGGAEGHRRDAGLHRSVSRTAGPVAGGGDGRAATADT